MHLDGWEGGKSQSVGEIARSAIWRASRQVEEAMKAAGGGGRQGLGSGEGDSP